MIEEIDLYGDIIDFKNNPTQLKFINAVWDMDIKVKQNNIDENAYFGAFRCGKSFAFQLSAFLMGVIYKNLNILYVRDTYKQLQDSVIRQFRKDFEKYGQFTYKKTDREAQFPKTGTVINFRAFDHDTGILSNEYDVVFICQGEDIKEDLFLQILGRLSGGKELGRPILFNEGNPASSYVKKRYKDLDKSLGYQSKEEELKAKNIYFIEGETFDNVKNLPKGYIERLEKNYPKNWINRYVYGGWEQIDEMVFNEFRESIHVIEPIAFKDIAQNCKIIMGGDYGYRNPACFLWAYKTYDDDIIVFDEFYESEQKPYQLKKAALKYGSFPIYYDYSIKRPDRDGRCLWTELKKISLDDWGNSTPGLNLIESNKDELNNIVQVNTLFKQERVFITRNCYNLINEIKNYKWKRLKLGEEKNYAEEAIDKDNHAIDSLLYLYAGIMAKKSIHPDVIANQKSIKALTVQEGREDLLNYG